MNVDPDVPSSVPVSPLSETERAVAVLWSEVLQTAELPSATDNFFALGGDSMAMVIIEFRIKEELLVDLPAGSILVAPSLHELSALIDAKRLDAQTPASELVGPITETTG